MCRHAWQLLGMLGNVLGRPRHALQRPRHALQRPRHACNVLGMLCNVLGVPHRSLVVHYSLDFTAYKAASGGGGFFDVGLLGRCKACRERLRMLPSMPRSCQACLHILGFHISFFHKLSFENSFCFLSILGFQTSFLVSKIENYF